VAFASANTGAVEESKKKKKLTYEKRGDDWGELINIGEH
jgi:hypothetical protein